MTITIIVEMLKQNMILETSFARYTSPDPIAPPTIADIAKPKPKGI